jgi:hypothetical protein
MTNRAKRQCVSGPSALLSVTDAIQEVAARFVPRAATPEPSSRSALPQSLPDTPSKRKSQAVAVLNGIKTLSVKSHVDLLELFEMDGQAADMFLNVMGNCSEEVSRPEIIPVQTPHRQIRYSVVIVGLGT